MDAKRAALEELRQAEDAFMAVLERVNTVITGEEELDEGWVESVWAFREQLEEELDTQEYHEDDE